MGQIQAAAPGNTKPLPSAWPQDELELEQVLNSPSTNLSAELDALLGLSTPTQQPNNTPFGTQVGCYHASHDAVYCFLYCLRCTVEYELVFEV